MKFNKKTGFYKNGNYYVLIMQDGTKMRMQPDDNADFIPSFAESMDITITQKCDGKCGFCYANCTPEGKHADLFKYDFINTLHPYTEVALNGNDLSHPQLLDFLKFLKSKDVIANITVNQRHFMEYTNLLRDWQKLDLVHGIGISYTGPDYIFVNAVKDFKNVVIHTIVGILNKRDIDFLKSLNRPILLLGYKNKGRGGSYLNTMNDSILNNTKWLENHIQDFFNNFPVVTFDNLAIDQLHIKDKLTPEQWEDYYMGDEGSVTFFIDMVKGTYARSSMDTEEFPITIGSDFHDNVDTIFEFIRHKYGGKIEGENKF